MAIKVFHSKVTREELLAIAKEWYGDMVKGVVDVQQRRIALGGELHADAEEVLLGQGSTQENLWGFNVYVDKPMASRLEYTSLINIRPRQGNMDREVQDPKLRALILDIVNELVPAND